MNTYWWRNTHCYVVMTSCILVMSSVGTGFLLFKIHYKLQYYFCMFLREVRNRGVRKKDGRLQLKCDCTLWRTGGGGKWRGNWRMECVASTLHTTSEHGVSSITTVDAHTLAASSRLNWRPRWFKWTRPFRQKTKYGFCACAITF